MEGSEKRIEKKFGLAAEIAVQRERTGSITYTGLCARAEGRPVWQQPSLAGGRDPIKPSHYTRHKIEPWDYVAANGLGYFEGSAIKYLTRWPYKNGIVDLKKARAFIDKLIAVEETKLVGDAGQEVGGQPATDHPKDGRNAGNGPE